MCRGKNEVPGGRRCDTHLKQLTESDLLPDNDPDTAIPPPQWAGEAPAHLYAQFPNQVANAALNALLRARDEEHAMTTGLLAAIEPTGAELAGLEFRLKAPMSLARKIATKAEERQITPKQAAATLEDTIRYTVTTPRAADVIRCLLVSECEFACSIRQPRLAVRRSPSDPPGGGAGLTLRCLLRRPLARVRSHAWLHVLPPGHSRRDSVHPSWVRRVGRG